MRGFLFAMMALAMMALAAGVSTALSPLRRRSPEPAPTPVDPEPTFTITVPASEKTAAAMERLHRVLSAHAPDPTTRPPGRPWSKTVRTEQQQAAVTAAQAKRDRRAARNLRRGA